MALNVALLRGINVGTAKTLSMAALASVFDGLGFDRVKTVMRSGNVVFASPGALPSDAAATIEQAILAATGVQTSVLVITAREFVAIAEANPLLDMATDGSKLFVTFVAAMPKGLEVPDVAALAPELLVVGRAAVYQWFPHGSQQTKVPSSFWKRFDATVTTRNSNTVRKLLALLKAD